MRIKVGLTQRVSKSMIWKQSTATSPNFIRMRIKVGLTQRVSKSMILKIIDYAQNGKILKYIDKIM